MTTAIELRTMDDLARFAKAAAQSGYFQDAQQAAQAMVKIAYGKELGLGPVAALSGVHIVKGNPTLSATTVASLIKRSGRYTFRLREHTTTLCTIAFYEAEEHLGDSTFTLDDARAAGLLNNPMWKKYARNMLWARALTNGARWHCSDVFHGPIYTPDELRDGAAELIEATATDVTEARAEDEPRALPERSRVDPETVSAIYEEADRLFLEDHQLEAALRTYGDGVEEVEEMAQADAEAMLQRMRARRDPEDERDDAVAATFDDEVTDGEWSEEPTRDNATENVIDALVQAWPIDDAGNPRGPALLERLRSAATLKDVADVMRRMSDKNPFKAKARQIYADVIKR